MRIYVDTSVFGGVFDKEFAEPTKHFFLQVDAVKWTPTGRQKEVEFKLVA